MLHLLLVDDEPFTRAGVAENIMFKELNISVVRQAEDGVHGLEIAKNFPLDILLTDVRMPNMDGIQLATAVRKLHPDCKIIFMSGYSDKDYLKSAIKLKATEYIEKPIKPDELYESIKRASDEIINARLEQQNHQSISSTLLETIPIVKQKLALALTKKKTDRKEINRLLELCHLFVPPKSKFVTLIIKGISDESSLESLDTDIQTEFEKISKDGMDKFRLDGIYCFKNDHLIITHLYLRSSADSKVALHKGVEDFSSYIIERLKPFAHLIIAVGEIVNSMTLMYHSYQTAAMNVQKGFFTGYGSVVFSNSGSNTCYSFDNTLIANFHQSLIDKQQSNALSIVDGLFHSLKPHTNTLVSSVKEYYYNLAFCVSKITQEYKIDLWQLENPEYFLLNSIQEASTLNELYEFIKSLTNLFFDSVNCDNINNTAWNIMKYIEKNYAKPDLSIQELSQHTGLTVSYLCVLFKNETGTTINQYTTAYRINKSKELLRDSANSLTDVAASVGYYDVNYFSKLFKKIVGMTPTQYRKSY